MEAVEPVLVLRVDSQYLLDRGLLNDFKHLAVCLHHCIYVNGAKRYAFRFRRYRIAVLAVRNDNLRGGVDVAAF
ncbi:MAG: hypothetical protein DDT29_01972 [Dehalococcoidia bacterium]|nr:hypothetical protein [Bacillota bacterium]